MTHNPSGAAVKLPPQQNPFGVQANFGALSSIPAKAPPAGFGSFQKADNGDFGKGKPSASFSTMESGNRSNVTSGAFEKASSTVLAPAPFGGAAKGGAQSAVGPKVAVGGVVAPPQPQPQPQLKTQPQPHSQPQRSKARWSAKSAQSAEEHNKAQLDALSSFVMLSRAATDVCDWEASLGLAGQCLDSLAPVVAELSSVVKEGEALAAQLRKEYAILNPTLGAKVGEDNRLAQVWAAKEGDFLDVFLRHRDRYLKLQQTETIRCLAEFQRDALRAQIDEVEGGYFGFASNCVAREYLRPDI